jgi:ferric-dicitrate binding protein FerR (iron transport regulator)
MTRDRCKRTWEVEALVDGRLDEKERSSLERHLAGCADCTRAREQMSKLSEVLGELPSPDPKPLEVRRQRAALLARANEEVVEASPRGRRTALVALAFAALVVLALAFLRGRTSPEVAKPSAPPAPEFEVADVSHADFASERVDSVSRVTLRSGSLGFHVEHVKPGARFIVAVPDGEVEVRGTRFTVDVVDGHTRAVRVTEGVVEVRLDGFKGLLRAGESWPRETAAVEPPPTQPTEAPSVTPPPPPPSATTSATAQPKPAVSAPTPGARFAEAMRAYSAGDYGEADRLLGAFVRDFPDDTRSEDAMFLVADARTRRGDPAGARAAAADYLRRYPDGLRAPAARRLAGDRP